MFIFKNNTFIICYYSLSVLKTFLHDPLVEWSKPSKGLVKTQANETGEIVNEKVCVLFFLNWILFIGLIQMICFCFKLLIYTLSVTARPKHTCVTSSSVSRG